MILHIIPSLIDSFIYIVNPPLFLFAFLCLNLRVKFRQMYLGKLKSKCSSVHDSESIQMSFFKRMVTQSLCSVLLEESPLHVHTNTLIPSSARLYSPFNGLPSTYNES